MPVYLVGNVTGSKQTFDIRLGAKKCNECDEYQSLWRRSTIFFAGVTGGLTFIAAGLSYIFQSVPEISARMFPRASIEVLSFAEDRSLILVNSGDGDVFVRSVNLETNRDDTDQFGTSAIAVGKTVKAGGTLSHLLRSDSDAADTERRRATIVGESGPVSQEWVDIANHIITGGDCFELTILHENDSIFQTVKSHYARGGATPMTMQDWT